ncbi:hypothetical protein ACIQBJ_13150 [Kitasatospora sp. NPDC088391]|uniref:hypothetical protein n=1 Tax=Kitasatospora sp. NPDC088391 TaxID=3364074 RepID=UPI00380D328F
MHDTSLPDEDPRTRFWSRVRQFAVPPTMIDTATARRESGDWGGACAAAGFDPRIDLRAVSRTHGAGTAARLRADLRHLAPDLLRWHLPRTAPDGLLRTGLTLTLARYPRDGPVQDARAAPLHLVARTAPARASAGQRVELALWDGADGTPHPDPRFRFDLHPHLWDARRTPELTVRAPHSPSVDDELTDHHFADTIWTFEAELLRAADGLPPDAPVAVRLGTRRHLLLRPSDEAEPVRDARGRPILPDAATWTPPDVLLLRAGLIDPGRLHPLVAAALAPGYEAGHGAAGHGAARPDNDPLRVECRGELHALAFVDGLLVPLDHPPEQLRREEVLVALGGTPLPCLRAIDRAHRTPESLDAIRQRLLHGDRPGALAAVRQLLGEQGVPREGPLAEALRTDSRRRVDHGLYANGLDPDRRFNGPAPVVHDRVRLPDGHPHRPRPAARTSRTRRSRPCRCGHAH